MTDYFVDATGGSDGNGGQSYDDAWQTTTNVTSLTNGDDVYFKCGEQWDDQRLIVNWEGVDADNRTIIGAYYGSGTIGVSGAKPIFDGSQTTPSTAYTGLVQVNQGMDYVTVQDLAINNSGDEGIAVGAQGAATTYVDVKRCDTNWTGGAGIIYREVDYGTIEGNDVQDAGNDRQPAAISLAYKVTNVVVQNNKSYAHDDATYGAESIGAYKNCQYITIQDNVVWDSRSGIEVTDSRDVIIRRNLVYGTKQLYNMLGIYIADTTNAPVDFWCKDIHIYNNLIAYVKWGTYIDPHVSTTDMSGILIYNNTYVDGWTGAHIYAGESRNSQPVGEIKNNVSWLIDGDAVHADGNSLNGMTWGYNNWSTEPADADAYDAGTDVVGSPLLSKTSGWTALIADAVDGTEFALTNSSPGNGQGEDQGSPYSIGINSTGVDYTASPPLVGTASHATPPDMGAMPNIIPKVLIFT